MTAIERKCVQLSHGDTYYVEAGTGFPGYDTVMGKDTATVAEVLKQAGYGTAWFGKNHNVPDWESSQAGPFDRWPTSLGFDYFYGFIGGDTNQWRPNATEGTKPIEPYIGNPDYNFDYDIADQATKWVKMQKAVAPDKPFFCYYAPGARTPPTTRRRSGSRSTRASSTRAGTRAVSRRSRGRRRSA